jgi:pyruvate kinase
LAALFNARPETRVPERGVEQRRQEAISTAVITLAQNIDAAAIVAETRSGACVQHIAAYRPPTPLIAVTSDVRVAQQLTLVYGVKSYVRPIDAHAASKLTDWLYKSKLLARGDIVVTASGRHPGVVGTTDTIKVRMIE